MTESKNSHTDSRIAVVILNWNGVDMLRRFLPSVVKGCAREAEVIVADNGSTDASCEVVEREFPGVRLIRLPENYGFADGYNKALAQVDADYFVLLNSDVEVAEGWITPLRDYMDAHPEVGACQPKLLSQREPEYFEYAGACGGYIDRYGYPFCRGRLFETVERDEGQYDDVCPVFWATGAALMIRRTDWESIGGLDGSFFAHMEEIDLCWRLRSRGRGIVCIPASRAYHVGGATLKKSNPRKTFLNFRNNLIMLYKNMPDGDLQRALRVRRVLDYVAALKFLLTGDVADCKAVFRARREFRQVRSNYDAAREENRRLTTLHPIPEMLQGSLLWRYYARGAKTFSRLKAFGERMNKES
ncbi:glycosyltransferase family 2 protein [Pseudoprevotella muciniphila]|uniref:Glycosyltransferase family 2 protein n=1 Tax=Pseudoprevotella muciniphila TaxID=2133944 RepID=A0A5P8E5P3_9BACT|nr:glycosyltransferase family 2 protein [Pseudoprevotella muciniphila]QFQ12252.1 glycosyltransferase family 2 protein [Pseudoprevotella muciniphila]